MRGSKKSRKAPLPDNSMFMRNGAHWALRKRDLPNLTQGPFDYGVSVWQAPHPSPEFKHIKVWWTRRYDIYAATLSLGSLFKKVYKDDVYGLLSDEEWTLKQLELETK